MSLNNIANMLRELGHREPALAAAQEAVGAATATSTAKHPVVSRPDLATSLSTLAIMLSELGRA